MKIAVYGDSFAAKHKKNPTPNWIDHLKNKYGTVDNYACVGSSLFYSIQEFKRTHEKYDKILFVVTGPGRILVNNPELSPNESNHSSLSQCDGDIRHLNMLIEKGIIDSSSAKRKLKIYEAIRDYFYYVKNNEFDNYVHKLMFDDITRTRSDAIVIPALLMSDPYISSPENDNSVSRINAKETAAWGITDLVARNHRDFIDIRNSHMTIENNEIFANKAQEWINGKPVIIDLNDFVTPMNKEFYLRPINE